jgi:hypothetical protein
MRGQGDRGGRERHRRETDREGEEREIERDIRE